MTVLVGYDTTAASVQAVLAGADEARRRGMPLYILWYQQHDPGDSPVRAQAEAHEAQVTDERLERLAEKLTASGLETHVLLEHGVHGGAAEAILTAAEKLGAELLVLGLRPRPTIEKVLMGSVARQVMRHAPCPVLTVKADQRP
jgi:nucleotide-binding universal stress UspA family protein